MNVDSVAQKCIKRRPTEKLIDGVLPYRLMRKKNFPWVIFRLCGREPGYGKRWFCK